MFSPQHRSPLHCHTQYVLGFPNITPLVMSIVFSVLRQCGGLYKVGGGVSLPLLSEFGDCGRFLFEQLFLIVSAPFWSGSDQKPLHMAGSWFEKQEMQRKALYINMRENRSCLGCAFPISPSVAGLSPPLPCADVERLSLLQLGQDCSKACADLQIFS